MQHFQKTVATQVKQISVPKWPWLAFYYRSFLPMVREENLAACNVGYTNTVTLIYGPILRINSIHKIDQLAVF